MIERYRLKLRLVDKSDAEFILSLRTNSQLETFISKTSSSLSDQEEWIAQYKHRENRGQEFYFIATDLHGKAYGTTRLYNFESESFEVGSWIFSKDSPSGMAVKADIIAREFGFDNLGFLKCRFQVRKANLNVLKYHKAYNPDLLFQDELSYYFELDKESFITHSQKLIRLLN